MKVKCPECKGKGEYEIVQKWQGKEVITPINCFLCNATGKVEKSATYTGIRRK